MDRYIAPLNRISGRIKQRILAENGIKQRHYAIGPEGETVFSNAQLAANAIRDCLRRNESELADVSMLASGSSGGDALMPGFANMIQGEMAAHPMETLSVHGICAAGVSAIQAAAQGVELGGHASALAVASELPSRLFKRSRFAARDYDADFDAHFLRWMLSDGAGALLLATPAARCRASRAACACGSGGCTSARSRATIRSACSWACRPTASAGTWTTVLDRRRGRRRAVAAPGYPAAAAPVRHRHPRIRQAGARWLGRSGPD